MSSIATNEKAKPQGKSNSLANLLCTKEGCLERVKLQTGCSSLESSEIESSTNKIYQQNNEQYKLGKYCSNLTRKNFYGLISPVDILMAPTLANDYRYNDEFLICQLNSCSLNNSCPTDDGHDTYLKQNSGYVNESLSSDDRSRPSNNQNDSNVVIEVSSPKFIPSYNFSTETIKTPNSSITNNASSYSSTSNLATKKWTHQKNFGLLSRSGNKMIIIHKSKKNKKQTPNICKIKDDFSDENSIYISRASFESPQLNDSCLLMPMPFVTKSVSNNSSYLPSHLRRMVMLTSCTKDLKEP